MGQGLSNYQKKTGISVNNHLEENLAKLSIGDGDINQNQNESDISINKKTINKSIMKMDAIVQDAINSKKELLSLIKSPKEDTGSLTSYLNKFSNEDNDNFKRHKEKADTDTSNEDNETDDDTTPEMIAIQGKSSIYGTRNDNLMQFGPPRAEPNMIPVQGKSSIYGTRNDNLMQFGPEPEPEPDMIQFQGKSSIYGKTSNDLIQFKEKHPDIELIPIEKQSSIYGTNKKNLSY